MDVIKTSLSTHLDRVCALPQLRTWLLTELDPEDPDRAFGLCDLGLGSPELGYVSLAELAALRGPLGLPVERDQHFDADGPLSGYVGEARHAGRVIT